MPEIKIDGKNYQVNKGKNLLEACQDLKLELPYFCWHPSLGSVGSCRQCAVLMYQDENDQVGRITMACMTPVTDGQVLSLKAPRVEKFRASLIEATMTNHPHDCPVCEEAGECHLQDMTLMSGHIDRRYEGPKRTHNNQYLGPFINHEMNRCISCYRCVRFYRDYSGGTDLNVFSSRNNVYFGRAKDGVLESEFSGNLAEVCPTGVFTDKTYSKHYTRKWELQSSPSICTHCSVGCNIFPGERNGKLRRITNRFHPEINGHFLCDRGRFGYEFVNHTDRCLQPWQRDLENKSTTSLDQISAHLALRAITSSSANLIAIGSSRSSLENNFALRSLVGEDNFYSDSKESEHLQLESLREHYECRQRSSNLKELEASDAVIMIGEDVTQVAPRIALSIRQMTKNAGVKKAAQIGVQYWSANEIKNIAQDLKSPFHIISSHSTRLDDVASTSEHLHPRDQVELLNSVIDILSQSDISSAPEDGSLAFQIAQDLRSAERPFVVTSVSSGHDLLLKTTLRLSQTLQQLNDQSGLICASQNANSFGLNLLCKSENHLDAAISRLENSGDISSVPDTLIIMETDLYRFYDTNKLDKILDKVENIVVLDHLLTPTAQQADLLLPTTSFAEYHGSWLNFEGRLQASVSCFPANDLRCPAYYWVSSGTQFRDLLDELASTNELLSELPTLYPEKSKNFNMARKTVRASGRTAQYAHIDIKEIPPSEDDDSPFQFSQEGVASQTCSSTFDSPPAYVWAPGWNSNESLSHFQSDVHSSIKGMHKGLLLYSDTTTVEPTTLDKSNTPFKQSLSEGELQALPLYHIFSGDELSEYSSEVHQLKPQNVIRINAKQANSLGLSNNESLNISFDYQSGASSDATYTPQQIITLAIDDSVPEGSALISEPILTRLAVSTPSLIKLEKVDA